MKLPGTPLRCIVLTAALLLPPLLHAQSPRMVLVEEATNASCGPCASQNPFFERYLAMPHNRSDIIPIAYRANFPGRDVMNAANPAMHNGRVAYYTISAVPTALVNGAIPPPSGRGYAGAPADTVAIAREANKIRGTISPITIDITESTTDTKVTATVDVSSTEALSGKKLHIVVVEGHHYYANAGSNGEKDFNHIARLMLPDHNGTMLDLAAGEKKSFSQEFTLDPGWTPSEIYIVAFVEDPSTKQVLQVGTDRGSPRIETTTATTIIQQSKEPGSWPAILNTNSSGEYTVEIEQKLPKEWSTSVMIGEQAIAHGDKINLEAQTPVGMNVTISPGPGVQGKGSMTVTLRGNKGGEWKQRFTIYASDIQALVITKDEGNELIANSYDEAMALGDVRYAVVERGDEHLFDYSKHVLVYEVGKWILERADIEQLRELFDRGGMRVYMIGAEIGYGLADPGSSQKDATDIEFMNKYLHADYISDDVPSSTVRGIEGDPIGDGLNFSITNGIQNQDTPDELGPRDGAVPILYYGTLQNQVAGIRYEDEDTRLIYLGFGAEGIGSKAMRANLLKRGIAWLLGSLMSVNDAETSHGTTLLASQPNPAGVSFTLPFRLERVAHVAIALHDMNGRQIAVLADGTYEPGEHAITYNASAIPSGTYIATMEAGGVRSSRMITIAR